MIDNKPLVSICCITYNHENYIRESIEGFLIQKTSFPIEIIIHDDASIDSTPSIVKEYVSKYPDLINPIFQEENQWSKGVRPSSTFVWPKARGKYIALCEGDDYWTDPYKLQKQIDFLEENSDFVLCFGNATIENNTKKDINNVYFTQKEPRVIDQKVAIAAAAPTCTIVFRNIISSFPKWFSKVKSGDYFLRYLLSKYGKFYYIPDIFATYRKHDKGISRLTDKYEWHLNTIEGLRQYKKECLLIQKKAIDNQIAKNYIYALFIKIVNKQYYDSFKIFFKVLFLNGFYNKRNILIFMRFIKEFLKNGSNTIVDAF